MATAKKTGIKQTTSFKFSMIALCAVIMAFFCLSTPAEGLEPSGWRTLGILLVCIILFISEAVPTVATCFTIVALLKYTSVSSMSTIVSNSASTTVFFSIAGMGLGAALKNTKLAAFILRELFKFVKGDSKRLITATCWLTAIISIFVSDGAAQIVCIAVITAVIVALGDPEPGTNRLIGGLMMAITVGSLTGGLCLPCSNTANVAIMELAETIGGKEMTFLQWGMYGIPIGLLLTFVASITIPMYFKPEKLEGETLQKVNDVINSADHLEAKDKYYVVLMTIMVCLWIASNWIKIFDTASVAMVGLALMMLPIPGLQLLDLKGYKKNFSCMVPVTMMCMFPLAKAMSSSGLGEWLVNIIFANATNWNIIVLYLVGAICAFILHMLIPSGNACGVLAVTVLGPVMCAAGIPVSAVIVCLGAQTGTSFLFPIEGTWQYTFGYNYYSFGDCLPSNWMTAVFGILESAFLIPILVIVFQAIGWV